MIKIIKIFLWLKIREIAKLALCLFGISLTLTVFSVLLLLPCFLLSYYFIPDAVLALNNAKTGFVLGLFIGCLFVIFYDFGKGFLRWIKNNWKEAERLASNEW